MYSQETIDYIKSIYETIYEINVQSIINEIKKISPYSEK